MNKTGHIQKRNKKHNKKLSSSYLKNPKLLWVDVRLTSTLDVALIKYSLFIFSIRSGAVRCETEFSRMSWMISARRSSITAANANMRLTLTSILPQKRRLEHVMQSRNVKKSSLFIPQHKHFLNSDSKKTIFLIFVKKNKTYFLLYYLSCFVKKTIISLLYYISVICEKKNKSVTGYYRFPDPIVAIIKTLFKKEKKKLPQASIYVLLRENWNLDKYDVIAVMGCRKLPNIFLANFLRKILSRFCVAVLRRGRGRCPDLRPRGGV